MLTVANILDIAKSIPNKAMPVFMSIEGYISGTDMTVGFIENQIQATWQKSDTTNRMDILLKKESTIHTVIGCHVHMTEVHKQVFCLILDPVPVSRMN